MDLKDLRRRIDELDRKIIQLLNDRTKFVLAIGKLKSKEGKAVWAPERESEIYQKIDKIADSMQLRRAVVRSRLNTSLFILIVGLFPIFWYAKLSNFNFLIVLSPNNFKSCVVTR